MRLILSFLFVIILIAYSCKNKEAKIIENPEIETSGGIDTSEYSKVPLDRFVEDERQQAQSILNDRYKDNVPPHVFFTTHYLVVDEAHQVHDTSGTLMQNEWLRLKEDWTYIWYNKQTVLHKGKYHFSPETSLLLLLSDQEDHFPSEWNVRGSDNIVILIGTSTFHNNDTQIKMISDVQPPFRI